MFSYFRISNLLKRKKDIESSEKNVKNSTEVSEEIYNFIHEKQSKIKDYDDIVLEWIPYEQLDQVKEASKNDLITVYSAIWKDGPLYKEEFSSEDYTRDSNKEVALKLLHNSRSSIEFVINEAIKFSMKRNEFLVLYGISQNPDTNDYILIHNSFISLLNWSGNEKIDDFIQEKQLKIKDHNDVVFEWIPYKQLDQIKEVSKNDLITVYSAIWMDGPLYKKNSQSKDYIRVSNKVVDLKLLHNSQRSIEFVINETKKFSMKNNKFLVLYGISQNPNTNDYILIHNSFISLLNWSGNKKIDDFIKEMQFRISDYDDDIVFEWIPYDQFSNINKIGIGGFATVYSTIWKDGPLVYNKDKKGYERDPNRVIALKCLDNSQNISVEFLNEVKEYSINKRSNVLNIHGISQNPDTKNYIMVLKYAEYGNFINWINVNYEKFDWYSKLTVLLNIIRGLKEIHQKNIVHRDFHTGNILILRYISNLVDNCISISDMGLCGEVDNIDKKNIYGVMPYVAPEVLRGKPYTQAADIYSFGMIMYFVATGRQPFADCAHDHNLALDICKKGIRPEINELLVPKCYIKLIKRCWDTDPNNRPNIIEIGELISSFHKSYWSILRSDDIKLQFKEAEEYRKENLSSIKNYQAASHPQAIYTSRLLNPFTKDLEEYDDNSKCLSCVITTDLSELNE
ncbi:hypothetical protein RclHR1_08200003 [Rhizophagus clarus]|uniref:Protein kinase domain-containing protein n=1 Tax=Rhizophagus clarus TaxID=94130 RepID=A0A2Z6S210_9GLOM|nr:hypothetical protein RclHR1_08200003 [Rhizophagus clarus]